MKLFTRERKQWRRQFFTSSVWRRMSAYQLKKNPLCEECKKRNIITPARCADHISAWETKEEFLNNPLQSLCFSCHREKTIAEDVPELLRREKLKMTFF